MTKTVSKVVVYFTDGTYQEVGSGWYGQGGGAPTPFEPLDPGIWRKPGEIGKWPYPPDGTGITIMD